MERMGRYWPSWNFCAWGQFCNFFFNITPLFAMGYISEGERSKVKQQWNICHKFQGLIMQDLPQLTRFARNRHRMGTRILHSSLPRDWRRKGERPLGDSNPRPCAPQVRFVATLASSGSSGLVFPASGALVKWPSGRIAQGPWGGRLFRGQVRTWPTTWAKSIQTTAPHGLGYSTSLACPLINWDS